MSRWAMVIDLRRCIGCHSCTIACQVGNKLPVGMFWNLVTTVGPTGRYPTLGYYHIPRPCFHCDDPPCVGCCPTGASSQRADGVVLVDKDKCIGCKACIMACPYGARTLNRELGVVPKVYLLRALYRAEQGTLLRQYLPSAGADIWRPGRPRQRSVPPGA